MASLLELLISRRVIAPEQARDAAGLAEETGAFIGRILVAQGAVAEDYLAKFLADECSVRMSEGQVEADGDLIHLLPERLMKRYRMVPLCRDSRGVLSIAVAEPLSKIDKIVLVGGDKGTGATKITAQVADILAQMPDVVESLTGVDLKKYFKNKLDPEDKKET